MCKQVHHAWPMSAARWLLAVVNIPVMSLKYFPSFEKRHICVIHTKQCGKIRAFSWSEVSF